MKVKNISSRAHHVGDKVIVPGETAEVPAGYEGAINTAELIEVDDEGDALPAAELIEVDDEGDALPAADADAPKKPATEAPKKPATEAPKKPAAKTAKKK